MGRKHRLLFTALLFTALAIRLRLAPMRGHVHDIEQLKAWTETAVTQNPLGVYSTSTANYPPLGLLPLWVMGHLYRALFSPEFDTSSTTLTALIKLPGITADLMTAVILYRYLNRQHGRRWAFTGMAAYAFNPAIIYDTAWWGQLESLATLPMLLSVLALADGRIRWAWFWLAVAVLVKPQAAVLGPVIAVGTVAVTHTVSLRSKLKVWVTGVGTAVFTAVVVLLPFILVGQLPALIAQIRASAGRQLFLTMNAHNFWYLVTLGRGSFAARETPNPLLDNQPLLGPLTGWQIGLLLFTLFTLLIILRLHFTIHNSSFDIHYSPPIIFWAAAGMVLGFYMLPAEAHERYLFPAFVFLVPLLPGGRPYQFLYAGFSLTFFLNLLWVDSAVPFPAFNQSFVQNLALAVPLAAINVGLFVFFAAGRFDKG